ncbi:Imidazole glycerol phosphate synthase subunit HisF [uncultured archaeon]|nr:Imidazole glycerol phosphate synthase subunit HisF [uncultured archaeon]
MYVIPSIDILNGKVAQLVGGSLGTEVYYGEPLEVAAKWVEAGTDFLHVVDLDAALRGGSNLDTIKKMKSGRRVKIHVGGGIRNIEYAKSLLDAGIDRIVLGTLAIEDYMQGFPVLEELNSTYGSERIIIAVDSKDGYVVVKGWGERTKVRPQDIIAKFMGLCWGFLYTDVDVEGRLEGINIRGVREVVESTSQPVIISGGITTKEDVDAIKASGAWGAVIGRAFYENKLDFTEFKRNY